MPAGNFPFRLNFRKLISETRSLPFPALPCQCTRVILDLVVHRSGDTSNGMSNVWATCNGHIDASSNHRSVMLRLNQMIDDRAVIMAVPESEQIELELL